MRRFVIGDIHGNYKALKQVLEKCGIDKENDLLITLGDITDGFYQVYECVEELLTFKNRIDIRGNHDDWFITWLNTGVHPDGWQQGGYATAISYAGHVDYRKVEAGRDGLGFKTNLTYLDIPETHRDFFHGQHLFYKDDDNNVFVHGGFYRFKPLKGQGKSVYLWDRDLTEDALHCRKGEEFKYVEEVNEVFIGHTPCPYFKKEWDTDPIHAQNVWNLDTGGGGRRGRLTIMQLDNHEFWQSDVGGELYPDGGGRNF
jgi:serine/threonine protein phosphatase 1